MTAIRDRQSDPDTDEVPVPWDARPIVGARRGLPWWGAVLLAFGLAVIGAAVDLQMRNSLGWLFQGSYFAGAVAAICGVQRRSLFGPMVQPPLVLAITVPGVVLLASGLPANSDMLAKALAIGTPLINGFPTMAITTGVTLLIGVVRIYRERNPNAPKKSESKSGSASKRPPSRKDEPAAARRGEPGRGNAARSGPPTGGRAGTQRRGAREPGATPPPGRRPSPEDARRGEPGAKSGKTPPPPGGRRRGPAPESGDRRRTGEARSGGTPGAARPRRTPPRPDDPRAGGQGDPRRAPGRRNPPPGGRPWDNEA